MPSIVLIGGQIGMKKVNNKLCHNATVGGMSLSNPRLYNVATNE